MTDLFARRTALDLESAGEPRGAVEAAGAQPAAMAGPVLSRRWFLALTGAGTLGLFFRGPGSNLIAEAAIPGGTLEPTSLEQFVTPLLIPPVMPRAGRINRRKSQNVDYYEIALTQFDQQILPEGRPTTTVWGYEPLEAVLKKGLLLAYAPSLTIEAKWNRPVRIKWVNRLVDDDGNYLPHLLPVDPTLHWANPPGGQSGRDTRPSFDSVPDPYTGPVPMSTHVHGAEAVGDESDGYAEAWFLPHASNLPHGYATEGTWYDFFSEKAQDKSGETWGPGYSVSQYPNSQREGNLWYHDHTLGMTRVNVYAGPAGFYFIRGGPEGADAVLDSATGKTAVLPGPAPRENDKFDLSTLDTNKTYREIPLAIQDRSFNMDGSLFYPDTRKFFDGIVGPYIGEGGEFSPIWNPEFFGNTIIVNGSTWPFHEVDQSRYRLRLLNGCQSRFLILDFNAITGVEVWQIGNEGGFLAAPVNVTADHGNRLLMAPAERADVIVDFRNVAAGSYELRNVGPDEPFGGGEPDDDFDAADPETTGLIMQFVVTGPPAEPDPSTPPGRLVLPPIAALPPADATRALALIEKMGEAYEDEEEEEEIEGPVEALLGNVDEAGYAVEQKWVQQVTENPGPGDTEVWEFYNTTGDAHPMHIHEVLFQVVNRQGLRLDDDEVSEPIATVGAPRAPEPWEDGWKDTVIAYPGEVTRVQMTFATAGQYVWHCHIVEHEDNEMMRPFRVGPEQHGQPPDGPADA